MRIAIPVDEKNLESKVSDFLGRAPYYLIYDDRTKESLFVNNIAAASRGGAGMMAASIIEENKINVLLTPRCGESAADMMKDTGIKIYQTIAASVKDNIDAFLAGRLPLLDEFHEGFHGQLDD